MNSQFDNMIKVLTYFANQCDMFRPMLEGVESLQQENIFLREQLNQSTIVNNRMHLNATFSADQANFGVAVSKNTEDEIVVAEKEKEDLYVLIKSVIEVGADNYDRANMEYVLDFYSMIDKIDFDKYAELWDLMDSQIVEEPQTEDEELEEDEPTVEEEVSAPPVIEDEDKEETEEEPVSLFSRFKKR